MKLGPRSMTTERKGDPRIPIAYSELFDCKVTMAALKKEMRSFKRSYVINQLAQINILVTITLKSTDDFRKVHRKLMDLFIDEETEAILRVRFGGDTAERRPLFFRQQILALMRLCSLECSEDAPLQPDGGTDAGFALGRCCLIMSDHLLSNKQERDISQGGDRKRRKHLAIQMGSTFELYNPTPLHHALARADITFGYLNSRSVNARLKRLLSGFDLKSEFRDATGLTIQEYRDLVFMVFAYYYSQKPDDLLKNTDLFKLGPKRFIGDSRVKIRKLKAFLALDSIKLADLSPAMAETRPVLPALDFVVFRRRPLLEIANDIFVCTDPSFLLEKLGPGLLWTVSNSFSTKKARGRALQGFGYLFELYVDHVMRQIFPNESNLFMSFPKFSDGRESFDGLAQFEDHLIPFEYKGGVLTQEAKYGGKIRAFERDLDRPDKFGVGRGAGVYQLVTKIEKLFHRDRGKRLTIPGLSQGLNRIRKVTPVLIIREPFMRFDFMNWMLNNRFQRLKSKSKISSAIDVAPLQVIDIDSLERLKPNLANGDFRLDQCLNARAARDPELLSSFTTFPWKHFFPTFGQWEDCELAERGEQILRRIKRLYFSEQP